MSVGLLVGAFSASRIRAPRPLVVAISVSFALPLFLVALAFALPLAVVAAFAFVWGVAFEVMGVLWFTTMQKNVPRESLSRVSSYDAMGSLMFGPIGLALAGPLVAAIGLQTSFLIAAVVVTVALTACLLAPSVRGLRAEPVEVS
jgi:predicted MFS family arabinose efflux permease